MSEELKPCPFCGSRPFFSESFKEKGFAQIKVYSAWCRHHTCPVRPVIEDDRSIDYVKKRWNTRAEQPTINTFEDLKKLRRETEDVIAHLSSHSSVVAAHRSIISSLFDNFDLLIEKHNTALKDNLGG